MSIGRGRLVAASVVLGVVLATLPVGLGGAVASPQDPCARFALRAGALVDGTRLAACLETRMARFRPTHTRTSIAGEVVDEASAGSATRFGATIRSVGRWRVVGRMPEVVSGVFRLAAWRLEPESSGPWSRVVLELTDDDLPVSFVASLALGRLRLPYLRTWSGWARSISSSCGECAGVTPPVHG